VEIYKSLTEAAQLLFSEHINRNFFAVQIDKNSLYNAGTPFLYVNLQDIFLYGTISIYMRTPVGTVRFKM
jgi:hypothetical protein